MKRFILLLLLASNALAQVIIPQDQIENLVTDLQAINTALGGKAASSHTHPAANISDSTNVGRAVLTLANPGAVRYVRINADNSITVLDAASFRADIGAGTSSFDGTFGSLSGTGSVLLSSGSYADPAWITSLAKAKVGLGNVDNTADADKPVSSAQSTALAGKATNAHAAAPGSDDTFTGDSITGLNNSGGVTQWDAVYLNGSSQWVLADANGTGSYPAAGLAVATASTGNATSVLVRGVVRNDAWNWTPGGRIYLSATPGGLTQTAPATSGDKVQDVGFALSAEVAWLVFDGVYVEVD
jgi:hypothetical protein